MDAIEALDQGALFSPCRRWRYVAWRRWNAALPAVAFIGMWPSIEADETIDDTVIDRCIQIAEKWGCGAVYMLNLFAWRADSLYAVQQQHENAIGPRNNEYIAEVCDQLADITVACWGVHGEWLKRGATVRSALYARGVRIYTLGLDDDGRPRSPLTVDYLPSRFAWPLLSVV